jgi:energy-coupling factor transporter ATP-binding protein EcfA2
VMLKSASIALIGDTGSGKTTQAGETAEYVKAETGLDTIYFGADRGGLDPIEHLLDLGVVTHYPMPAGIDPFVWANHVTLGERFDEGTKRWEPIDRTKIGLWIFESGTSLGEECMNQLAKDQASGKSVGGKSSFNVQVGDVKVASNTETHFGLVQTFLRDRIWESQRLPGIVMWTFRLRRGEDTDRTEKLGVLLAGGALSMLVPSWFRYTFRIDGVPGMNGSPARHVLYLQEHTDGRLSSFGNARVPLAGFSDLGAVIEPASVPEALRRIERAKQKAREETARRLGLKVEVKK